ncbi:HEAT repeat domain-containing protein [bacterium]|nr:HEAT repeat domain-containing protein [candidate division CSSED10-310 bacterium]
MRTCSAFVIASILGFMVGCSEHPLSGDVPESSDRVSAPDQPTPEPPLPDVMITSREQALAALNHRDLRIRWQAVGFIRAHSASAMADLTEAMNSPHEDVVCAAVAGIGAIGPADAALPILVNALDHPQATVRTEAVIGLGQLGPAAASAVPAIEARMNGSDARFQEKARESLVKIRP